MSRIDEALKRASVGVVDPRRDPSDPGFGPQRADESLLDQYPIEGLAPAREEPIAAFSREETVATFARPAAEIAPRRPAPLRPMPVKGTPQPVSVAFDEKLVVGGSVTPMLIEQYRRLAAAIHELHVERGLKVLTVTSAVPREGKTLTVANLALTLGESYGRRVLLIDADLRRPSIHTLFGVANTTGLIDVLRSDRSELPLQRVTPMLSVLPAGTPEPNPVAGITSARMRTLIDEASAAFDWVLLDAPPVAAMPDAALLGSMTRAVLLVIAAGSTPYPQVVRAIDEVGRDCIIGTVLNRIEERNIPDTTFYRAYEEPLAAH